MYSFRYCHLKGWLPWDGNQKRSIIQTDFIRSNKNWRRQVGEDKILELVIDPYERSRVLIRTEACLIKVGEITSSKPKIKKLFLSGRLDHFIETEENSASLRIVAIPFTHFIVVI